MSKKNKGINKLSSTVKGGNNTLNFFGKNRTEPIDAENRNFQTTIETDCGQACKECGQYKAGLCYGCYNGCLQAVRSCVAEDCRKPVTFVNDDAEGTVIRGHCAIRCCKRTDLAEWHDDVSNGHGDDLSIQQIRWEPISLSKMGKFVPSINGHMEFVYVPYVTIPVNYLYSEKTQKMRGGKKTVHEMYKLHPDTEVIVTGYCKDDVLESFWVNRKREYLMERLKEKGVTTLMGFNYSVYHGDPRMEHLINIRRCFATLDEAQQAGLNAIPDICWHNSADLNQFVEWINKNKVSVVSTSMQCCRENAYIAKYVYDLDYIVKKCPDVKRWLINGPSTPSRIRMFVKMFPDMVLVSSRAGQLAKYNMIWDYKCNDYVKCIKEDGTLISRAEAFKINCQFFDDVVNGVGLEKFGDSYFQKEED